MINKYASIENSIENIQENIYNIYHDIEQIKKDINTIMVNQASLKTEVEWIKKLKIPVIFIGSVASLTSIIYLMKDMLK